MFTGLVEAVGELVERKPTSGGFRLRIASPLAPELAPGDSLAVNGVCLTVIAGRRRRDSRRRRARDAARHDARQRWRAGALVNLERPLRADSRFGGHFVQGHVDAIGCVEDLRARGRVPLADGQLSAAAGAATSCRKGSIAVDGISLTVAGLGARSVRRAGRAVHARAHQPAARCRSATGSTSNATWSASTSCAPRELAGLTLEPAFAHGESDTRDHEDKP